ncbi:MULTISPECIES: PAS domain S-box protein [unclassified Undibacterium]|uniref:PAS domain-containing sensor histidine kinase n=1 Tax=unclassified Undibacterium TaxID=2630295 RepID=UPI002AC8DEE6|nr:MULTISPECIES: PAS domain S-box protein [unclassified Undibacterium]MEB0139201.1 PAS domain S-box protein [Undibacterium sp. CCC2.1]MEB0172224.1 PAS domain S-box protein [Undibacterium sp. CCC1.1]MEB0175919.1 PAS domain S-box protein [Undibacterium sp. CCC3.4]MEB0215221.1 PAS domain S-box protein [Undibacterium sp. 5I2]WPX43519.1 PAS domain S-box protein [Undibacterium sp. CCC3.4]
MPQCDCSTDSLVVVLVPLLTMVLFMYVSRQSMPSRSNRYWSAAFGTLALCQLWPQLVAAWAWPSLLGSVLFSVFASLLWVSLRLQQERSLHLPRLMLAFSVAVLSLLTLSFVARPQSAQLLPAYLYAGVLMAACAGSLWRDQSKQMLHYQVFATVLALESLLLLLPGLQIFVPQLSRLSAHSSGARALLEVSIAFLSLLAGAAGIHSRLTAAQQALQDQGRERQDAEQLTKERQAMFEKVFQVVPDVLLICRESDGVYIEVNRHWEHITGYTRAESLGRVPADFDFWIDPKRRQQMVDKLKQDGELHDFQASFRHRNGHEFHVSLSAARFQTGGETYVINVIQDVTVLRDTELQRQKIEGELQLREKLLSTVFQLVPDTLTITRLEGGIYVDVNRNWAPLLGYSREEVIGLSSADLNLWVNPQQRSDLIAKIMADGEVRNMQVAFRRKDGSVVQCVLSGSRFGLEDQGYMLLSSHSIDADIAAEDARVLAERQLRENESKYSSLFQFSPIPLGLIDLDSRKITEVNDVWLKQFGSIGRAPSAAAAAEAEFWCSPAQPAALLSILAGGGSVDQIEVQIRNKDGAILICQLSARLLEMNRKAVGIFSLLDVTRQIQVEQEIREMTAQLEQRVLQRTSNLEQANSELAAAMKRLRLTQQELIRSEKMAALGSLVAGVAHELNTPLGNSVTVASTLEDKTREFSQLLESGQIKRASLERYLDSSRQGAALLMRNLGIARELIGSFKQVAVDQASSQRRQFDLAVVLDEVIATLSPMYKKGPFSLTTDLAVGIAMDSYPGPLGQIITNFMTNALVHAFDGRAVGVMHLRSRLLSDEQVEIIFSDDGNGISASDQEKVFDPFFTTKLGRGGSGLGMNIAYNLVTGVIGGIIELHSQLGAGTEFRLLLPRIAPTI